MIVTSHHTLFEHLLSTFLLHHSTELTAIVDSLQQ